MARAIAKSWEGRPSRRLRKKVETLFAHLKRIVKLDRLQLCGPNGAHDEFVLAATAQNPRKLAKLVPMPQPKPACDAIGSGCSPGRLARGPTSSTKSALSGHAYIPSRCPILGSKWRSPDLHREGVRVLKWSKSRSMQPFCSFKAAFFIY